MLAVHRGAVTGAEPNLDSSLPEDLKLPEKVLFRSVTRARDLFRAGEVLDDASGLRFVIDLPEDLDQFAVVEKRQIETFLRLAKERGADQGYVAQSRRKWWSVGLKEPAPILATYMARRSPAFVRNEAAARHINIAHGLYPREHLSTDKLAALAHHLNTTTDVVNGRTYAGGLTKFEPREMERLLVPAPDSLVAIA